MRLRQRNQALEDVDSQVGVPWDLMKTNTICPHERGDSYNIISIQASRLCWILSKIRFNFEDDYSVEVQLSGAENG